jgi:hypothetical protein
LSPAKHFGFLQHHQHFANLVDELIKARLPGQVEKNDGLIHEAHRLWTAGVSAVRTQPDLLFSRFACPPGKPSSLPGHDVRVFHSFPCRSFSAHWQGRSLENTALNLLERYEYRSIVKCKRGATSASSKSSALQGNEIWNRLALALAGGVLPGVNSCRLGTPASFISVAAGALLTYQGFTGRAGCCVLPGSAERNAFSPAGETAGASQAAVDVSS